MCFRMSESALDLYVGEKVDLLYTLGVNEYAGRRSLQLIVKDRRPSDDARDRYRTERDALAAVLEGREPAGVGIPVPGRRDFAAVYRLLSETASMGERFFPVRSMLSRLTSDPTLPFGYLKLGLILHVFAESGLITLTEEGKDLYSVDLCKTDGKVDLEKSPLLSRIKRLASL